MQVYLPMSYVYGRRGTCKETPLTAALRCVGARVRGVSVCVCASSLPFHVILQALPLQSVCTPPSAHGICGSPKFCLPAMLP